MPAPGLVRALRPHLRQGIGVVLAGLLAAAAALWPHAPARRGAAYLPAGPASETWNPPKHV